MTEPVSHRRRVHILGVPLDHGAGRRGVSMGPSAIRIGGLHDALRRVGCEIQDDGDVTVEIPETLAQDTGNAKYLPLVARVCQEVSEAVEGVLSDGGFPLVIGGDHSLAIGTISGVASHLQRHVGHEDPSRKLGVLWFDAHGDLNTPESSPSGNIHGMPVACLLGRGPTELTSVGFAGPKLRPKNIVQIGLRDLDEQEKDLLQRSEIHAFTMADIDRLGMARVMDDALSILADVDFLHVDFDIDVLDPQVAPGTGTRKMGGFSYREAHLALEMVAETGRVRSFELVEVNPILDERNRTAELAVGLTASALGARIL